MLKAISILALTLFLTGAIDGAIWLGCGGCTNYFNKERECIQVNGCVVSDGELNYNENSDACLTQCWEISKLCRVACFAAHDQCQLRCEDHEQCFVNCFGKEFEANTQELGVAVP